jgi:tRNA:m4X modification enzyme
VALDSRRPHKGDQFYDPDPKERKIAEDAPYTRVVADVRYLAARTLVPLKEAKNGGVIAITKHLCGGATDGSLVALCAPPLDTFVGACCFAPCCHQKTRRHQYCNIPYLESLGFCQTHIGLRGGVQDNDFRSFGMLISMSKHPQSADLEAFEYKKSVLLKTLGMKRARQLGRHTRRILEEGRMRYLREKGFDAHLVRYCDASITGDNLAIIARRRVDEQVKDKSQ